MRDYPKVIQPNAKQEIGAIGNFIKVKSATGDVRLVAENKDGQEIANILASEGTSIRINDGFRRVLVSNESENAVSCVVIVGYGDVQDSELSGTITSSVGTQLLASTGEVDATESVLLAANDARRSLVIQNTSGTDAIYIGGAGVTVDDGFIIGAGSVMTIDKAARAEIRAISTGLCNVRILEELN